MFWNHVDPEASLGLLEFAEALARLDRERLPRRIAVRVGRLSEDGTVSDERATLEGIKEALGEALGRHRETQVWLGLPGQAVGVGVHHTINEHRERLPPDVQMRITLCSQWSNTEEGDGSPMSLAEHLHRRLPQAQLMTGGPPTGPRHRCSCRRATIVSGDPPGWTAAACRPSAPSWCTEAWTRTMAGIVRERRVPQTCLPVSVSVWMSRFPRSTGTGTSTLPTNRLHPALACSPSTSTD